MQAPLVTEELMDACYHFSWRLSTLQHNLQDTAQPPMSNSSMSSGKTVFTGFYAKEQIKMDETAHSFLG